eukprot:Pgem_evm1s16826
MIAKLLQQKSNVDKLNSDSLVPYTANGTIDCNIKVIEDPIAGGKACPISNSTSCDKNCPATIFPKDCEYDEQCGECNAVCKDSKVSYTANGTINCNIKVIKEPIAGGKPCPISSSTSCVKNCPSTFIPTQPESEAVLVKGSAVIKSNT